MAAHRSACLKAPVPILGAVAFCAIVGLSACREYPTRSINRRPAITSVVVFPTSIGPGESTLVTVFASDPDGDTLVYDWFTDGRLRIKDAPGGVYLFHQFSRSRIFYRPVGSVPSDSAWIGCDVRDVRGGGASRKVQIDLRD